MSSATSLRRGLPLVAMVVGGAWGLTKVGGEIWNPIARGCARLAHITCGVCPCVRAACARTNQMVEGRHEIQLRRVSSQSEREFNLEAEHEVCA